MPRNRSICSGSIPLTSANIIKLLSHAPDIQGFYGDLFTLKLLAESPESHQVAKHIKLVVFGGSPRLDELSEFLVSQAVRLVYASNVVYVRVELLVAGGDNSLLG